MQLVLASTSPYRRTLLTRLGLPFEAQDPGFDETGLEGSPPAEVARRYAEGKARALAGAFPRALIIGSDQVLEHEGRQLRKPADLDEAAGQLVALGGSTHSLHAAVAVLDVANGRLEVDAAKVDLTLRPLTLAQAQRYVALDQPHGCVGGYTFEGRGVCLFEDVQGADESAIVGLPLLVVTRLLRRLGVEPLDLWEDVT